MAEIWQQKLVKSQPLLSEAKTMQWNSKKKKKSKRTKYWYKLVVQIHTALKDKERVCKMSSMVFKTRPLQSRWGNLVEKRDPFNLGHNEEKENTGSQGFEIVNTHVSAKPERYLSATLRILLCVWLKLTSKNWACRSSSSSCSLVLG